MMSSIIENRITRTIIVLLMIGTMILPVPLFKSIYISPLMIRIALADSTPPYINHDPITKSKAGESLQITATINDESDIKEVLLYYMKGKDTGYHKVSMDKTEGKDNQFEAVVPFTDVVGEKLVYFIEARDKFGNMSQSGDQSNPFSVKVVGLPPKPPISHIPITKSQANESIEIKAKIGNQNIIESAALYYLRGGESKWENIPMAPKEGTLYQATIPGKAIKSNRIKYYIEVLDKFGNQTTLKDPVGEPFVIEVSSKPGPPPPPRSKLIWVLLGVLAVGGIIAAGSGSGSSNGGSNGYGTVTLQ